MNVCSDCKHFNLDGAVGYAGFIKRGNQSPQEQPLCKHPDAATRDMVFGKTYCEEERNSAKKSACGKEGKLWERK